MSVQEIKLKQRIDPHPNLAYDKLKMGEVNWWAIKT